MSQNHIQPFTIDKSHTQSFFIRSKLKNILRLKNVSKNMGTVDNDETINSLGRYSNYKYIPLVPSLSSTREEN